MTHIVNTSRKQTQIILYGTAAILCKPQLHATAVIQPTHTSEHKKHCYTYSLKVFQDELFTNMDSIM